MKTHKSSKNSNIRDERDLIYHFQELLNLDSDLEWSTLESSSSTGESDGYLEFNLDGQAFEFEVELKLKPSIPDLERILQKRNPNKLLLVVPNLSKRILNFCKEKQLSCIDVNGKAWLRAKGLLVDRGALPGRSFRHDLEPRNIFTGKSGRVVRTLLTDRERIWTQAELVNRTKASSGMVSRLVQHCVAQSFLEKLSAREYRLLDFEGLLNAWSEADSFKDRCTTTRYAGSVKSLWEIANSLVCWSNQEGTKIAFTQWLAAFERHPYTEPVVCSAYVQRLPDTAALESLGLRPVEEGGKVWLHIPKEDGVFIEKQISPKHALPLVSDAQIYVDLKDTGLRGPEAANALRGSNFFCIE